MKNPLADPNNWALHYIESEDTHQWCYTGPEVQPWKLAEVEAIDPWNTPEVSA